MLRSNDTGEFAFKSHMKSGMHQNNSRIGGEQAVILSSFGFVSCGNGNFVSCGKRACENGLLKYC